jgi:3-mercaptopyruvate sulfurtransferase SseA
MNSMHLVICVALAASTTACAKGRHEPSGEATEAEKAAFGKLTVDELEARMGDAKAGRIKLAVFDNNQHERFAKSHIPGAKWVAFDAVQASDLPVDKDATLVFYCANEH